MELKPDNKIFAAAALTVFAVVAVIFMIPSSMPTGHVITQTTTTLEKPAETSCGDGICNSPESCETCPNDCSCVKLRLTKDIKYEQFLVWCSARIRFAAINSGNSDSTNVQVEIKTEVPHLNIVRDRKILKLGDFPSGMSPVLNETVLNYDCGDDVVKTSILLYDDANNTAYIEEERR